MGRPYASDSHARRARFLTLIASGATPSQAVEESRISDKKAIALLSEEGVRSVVAAIREDANRVAPKGGAHLAETQAAA